MPFGMGKGKPLTSIYELVYRDGTIEYKCCKCDFARPRFAQTWGHLGSHTKGIPKNRRKKTPPSSRAIREMSKKIAEMITSQLGSIPGTDDSLVSVLQNENAELRAENKKLKSMIRRVHQASSTI